MICWFCHWGWPKAVADVFFRAKNELGDDDMPLLYGPAHIVWADENWDCAKWCLEHFEKNRGDYDEWQLSIVRHSLEEIIALPDEAWDIVPDDYDGKHPENYPPLRGTEMVQP